MGRQARIRAERRRERRLWRPVTNRDVAAFADPKCKRCDGTGQTTDPFAIFRKAQAMCSCARTRFYRRFAGRIRRGPDGLEFKPEVTDAVAA
jgi:hypothetical protein